ncbi:MAG: hypothetical protein PHF57_05800 [Methanoregula sp.]|nr:hypothetical protein [Methanoregula sp.]MDD5187702.1 hypothetical protein [Methanoregula sp.]
MLTATTPTLFAVVIVILIGLLAGRVIGLLIGFLLKRQKPVWADMSRTDRLFNVVLVMVCSALFIAGLAFLFL